MASEFPIPTPQDLRDTWDTEIINQFPDAKPTLRMSFFRFLGRGVALLVHGLYLFLANIARQIFVSTADTSFLDRHGEEIAVTRRPAAAATGNTIATGTNGTAIPINTRLQVDGVIYETLVANVISGGTATLSVQAITFGADTNQVAGTIIKFITPIAGIATDTTVDVDGLILGADKEDDEPYRRRILFKKRNTQEAGSEGFYISQTLSQPNVTRVFVADQEDGPCTVKIRFMVDDKEDDGIPLAGDVTVVQAFIDTVKTSGIDVTVAAPVAQPEAFSIAISPNTAAVQTAITNAMKDLFIRESVPGGTIPISKIRQTVSNAIGESDNDIISPTGNITAAGPGDIMTLTTPITFSSL